MAKKVKTSIAIEPEFKAELEAEAAKTGATWSGLLIALAKKAMADRKVQA